MRYKRKWNCGLCDGAVIYDEEALTISCKGAEKKPAAYPCRVTHLSAPMPLKTRQEHYELMTEESEQISASVMCPMLGFDVPRARCMFCSYGHMLECHHPFTCDEAECSHYQQEMQEYEIPTD